MVKSDLMVKLDQTDLMVKPDLMDDAAWDERLQQQTAPMSQLALGELEPFSELEPFENGSNAEKTAPMPEMAPMRRRRDSIDEEGEEGGGARGAVPQSLNPKP